MPEKNFYPLKDVRSLTGCSHRQLQYWEQKGYLKPRRGPRNVRLYNQDDIALIKKLIEAKEKGCTLGEAWGENKLETTTRNPLLSTFTLQRINAVNQVSGEWMAANKRLLDELTATSEIEKNVPRYPYSLYTTPTLDTLKSQHEKIRDIIKKRDALTRKLRSYLRDLEVAEDITLTREEKNIATLDALILYWAKIKGGTYSKSELSEIRESFASRLQRGESFQEIIIALKTLAMQEAGLES